jgi:hypothetical protein
VARLAPVTLRLPGSDERQRNQTIELCPESGIDLCTHERDAAMIMQIMDTSCRTIAAKHPAASREYFF